MSVTDPDPETKWNWPDKRIAFLCTPDDNKPPNTGKWSAVEGRDVFGFGTGNNGWYYWRRSQGLLYLTRPDPNRNTLVDSLIRFFDVKEMTNGTGGYGMCPFPSPPAKGELYK